MPDWRPTASLEHLQLRARLLSATRNFFESRSVLEVEVPILSCAGGTDMNIELFEVQNARLLASSPEFPLKRLVAAGYGAVYSLGKVFRFGESGRRHNTEFTMLEWYRPNWSMEQLMAEVEALLVHLLQMPNARYVTYRDVFIEYAGIDPFTQTTAQLADLGHALSQLDKTQLDRDGWLDIIFSHLVEPKLTQPTFMYNFPSSQAALAKIDHSGTHPVARRFELVWQGVELANGYDELIDADEQLARFQDDNRRREELGKPLYPIDMNLVEALKEMPATSGVAIGFDRVVMKAVGTNCLADIVSFSDQNA